MPEVPAEKQVPPQQQLKEALRQIRTYQGDVAEALSKQNESLVSINRAERVKQSIATPEPKSSSTFALFAGGVLLILFTAVGGWLTYNEFIRKTAPPTPVVPASRFISAESAVGIDLTGLGREQIFQYINEAVANTKPGELKHLVLRNGVGTAAPLTNTSDFLQRLGTAAPGNLVRAFESVFMLGTLGQSRFLIFKLASFPNAFAGMLEWERTLAPDLSGLFKNSEILKSISSQSVFNDVVRKNKDARALFVNGEPAILYSFFDNEVLIITDDFATLEILIERLTREKLSR